MSINNIDDAYELTAADKRLINQHFTGNSDEWKDDVFDELKKEIRTHLWDEQERTCCYCKVKIKRRKQSSDIEHIIPKSRHTIFTFHTKNLALACKACNSSKGKRLPLTDQTTLNNSLARYPRSSARYNIIHPHFDNYFEYMELLDDVLLHSISDKGDMTVDYCKLYEPESALDRAEDILNDPEDVKGLFLRLVRDLPTEGFDDDDDIFDRLEEILDLHAE